MICKFCGAEVSDGATYCMGCGKRIDGKIVCKRCGTENPETAAYCTKCGNRIDGKHTCPSCGAVLEAGARFCPDCGHVLVKQEAEKSRVSSRLELSGAICVLAAAAFALIFVFCLGLVTNVSTASSSQSAPTQTAMYLYDYFGKIYRNVREAVKALGDNTEYVAYSYYFRFALGTLVSAGVLIAVPVCAAIAGVRFARYLRGKTEKADYFTPSAAAFALLLCGACALLALNYASSSAEGAVYSVTWNGATIAGVVLSGVSLLAGCALLLAAQGRMLAGKIAKIVLAAVGTALAVVVLAVTACGALSSGASGYTTSGNVLAHMLTLGMQYISAASQYGVSFTVTPAGAAVVAAISVCAQLTVIALTGVLLVRLWKNLFGEKRRSLLAVSIPLFVCALLYLVMNAVFANLYANWMTYYFSANAMTGNFALSYVTPIVTLVFAALLFAVSIVDTVFAARQKALQE